MFVERFHLIHEYRKLPFYDPDLPLELLPKNWLRPQAASLFNEYHDYWPTRLTNILIRRFKAMAIQGEPEIHNPNSMKTVENRQITSRFSPEMGKTELARKRAKMRYAETGFNLEIDLSRGSIEREATDQN